MEAARIGSAAKDIYCSYVYTLPSRHYGGNWSRKVSRAQTLSILILAAVPLEICITVSLQTKVKLWQDLSRQTQTMASTSDAFAYRVPFARLLSVILYKEWPLNMAAQLLHDFDTFDIYILSPLFSSNLIYIKDLHISLIRLHVEFVFMCGEQERCYSLEVIFEERDAGVVLCNSLAQIVRSYSSESIEIHTSNVPFELRLPVWAVHSHAREPSCEFLFRKVLVIRSYPLNAAASYCDPEM